MKLQNSLHATIGAIKAILASKGATLIEVKAFNQASYPSVKNHDVSTIFSIWHALEMVERTRLLRLSVSDINEVTDDHLQTMLLKVYAFIDKGE